MNRAFTYFWLSFLPLAISVAVVRADERPSNRTVDFNRDIRPVLSQKCFRCHGPDSAKREADLRLDREESAKSVRQGSPVILPHQPQSSEFFRRITTTNEDERMPPVASGKALTDSEIATLKRWIEEGAAWSHPWSYVPPIRHATPTIRDNGWRRNWIDDFVLAKLESMHLTPSPDAEKATLVRRLFIDLTGLPPRPADVESFVRDSSEGAYEQLVDRLLGSRHYGERMASYWFDLVRYASTVGYHGDQDHAIAPYRDYVIEAFNANVPFDQFTREQLAGDLLLTRTADQIIASGYNRLLQTSHEGGIQPKEYMAIYGADRVRNVSNVWMGATMGCAQCHDHKFDPYTIRDFYAMKAFFADIDELTHLTLANQTGDLNKSPTSREPEMAVLDDVERAKVSQLEARLATLKQDRDAAADDDTACIALENEIAEIRRAARRTMITVAIKEPNVTKVLPRGNWLDETGEVVQPAVPEFMGKLPVGGRRATRLDLANWLTDAKQGSGGLTARVMVNRFWYLMFGRGLAAVLDDFGGQGESPSHPELLDNLAIEFVQSGWDTKHILKLIAMSRAYRQSSRETIAVREQDPLNALVSHQRKFRFPAEMIRDSSLMVSGLLVDKLGGQSVRPYQPTGYYRNLNFPEREYEADLDDRQWRRSVYMHWQRQYLHPMLKAFDAPSREECTAHRSRSNTPLAALVLLNDPTFVESARAFATRILTEADSTTDSRLDFAFRQVMSRVPTDHERAALKKLLDQSHSEYAENVVAVKQLLSIGLKPIPENIDRNELASWTVVSRTILSLNEALTRN